MLHMKQRNAFLIYWSRACGATMFMIVWRMRNENSLHQLTFDD